MAKKLPLKGASQVVKANFPFFRTPAETSRLGGNHQKRLGLKYGSWHQEDPQCHKELTDCAGAPHTPSSSVTVAI